MFLGEKLENLEKKFTTERSKFPPLCLVTSCDQEKYGIWSKEHPTEQVLVRLTILARHAIQRIDEGLLNGLKVDELFIGSSSKGYNVVIELKPFYVKDFSGTVEPLKKHKKNDKCKFTIGFEPIQQFLQELRVRLIASVSI